ncbi:hypothetical protein QL996_01830 [Planococcus sp. APC 4015]|nr:hypothetical protein [Planococcus sp. APC 4015]
MTRTPTPLPLEFRGRPFVAPSADLTRGRTRAADLWSPTRGTRLPSDRRDIESRCRAHALTLPPVATFSHFSAAALWDIPLPRTAGDVIHVTTPSGRRAPRRRDVVGHQSALAEDDVRVLRGIRVTSPVRTFIDLAAFLPPNALVAVADRIVSRRTPLATEAAVRQAIDRSDGMRGIKNARIAAEQMDAGSESPKETELRLILCSAGFGPFETNHAVYDAQSRFVARVDLALRSIRIAVEYEGDHHRDREQWRRDIARRRRLEAEGWHYLPVTQADLSDPRQLLRDLSAAIAARG